MTLHERDEWKNVILLLAKERLSLVDRIRRKLRSAQYMALLKRLSFGGFSTFPINVSVVLTYQNGGERGIAGEVKSASRSDCRCYRLAKFFEEINFWRKSEAEIQIAGEVGRWQLEKIAIVFLVSIPGLAHIFVSAFVFAKVDFW